MQSKLTNNSTTAFGARLRVLTRFLTPLITRPATHIVIGLGILALDLLTPPSLTFPILFVLPVALSALFCSRRLAYVLAVLLPFGLFLIAIFVDTPGSIAAPAVNALIRAGVLSFLGFLVAHTAHLSREIKVLRGRLPICMWCKRIRDEDGSWQKLETYIAEHSEADFSHGLCAECKQEHYGDLFDKKRNAQPSAPPNGGLAPPANSGAGEQPPSVS
jgi:hypothetical protein